MFNFLYRFAENWKIHHKMEITTCRYASLVFFAQSTKKVQFWIMCSWKSDIKVGVSAKNSNEGPKEITRFKWCNLLKSFPEDVISYYPNPVKEQLYVKWDLINGNKSKFNSIVFIKWLIVKIAYQKLERPQAARFMPLHEYPQDYYLLLLLYASGEQKKSVKIVKE